VDPPRAVQLEPQELDHAGVLVVQVEVKERPVSDGADQLAPLGALDERPEVRVAIGELGRVVRAATLQVAGIQRALEGARKALHLELHRRCFHQVES
jgi:hypothetical protein